jgi:hypothetical protein
MVSVEKNIIPTPETRITNRDAVQRSGVALRDMGPLRYGSPERGPASTRTQIFSEDATPS